RRLDRPSELPADQHRQQPADYQEEQPHEQEPNADGLVVGGEEVLLDEAQLMVLVRVGLVMSMNAGDRMWNCGHSCILNCSTHSQVPANVMLRYSEASTSLVQQPRSFASTLRMTSLYGVADAIFDGCDVGGFRLRPPSYLSAYSCESSTTIFPCIV